MKKIACAMMIAVACLAANRAAQISSEKSKEIFNTVRSAETDGLPVETMEVKMKEGTLYEPVFVKNGRIMVFNGRVAKFKPGQKLSGGGRITAISKRVDMDTGMFTASTTGASGSQFVQLEYKEIFVPLSAISDTVVMVAEDGFAVERRVEILASDAEYAVVKGLKDGDIVILTKVEHKARIRPINKI